MAATTQFSVPAASSPETPLHAANRTTVKTLAESSAGNASIPPEYCYSTPDESASSEPEDALPVIDYSMLTSADPAQRSKAVQDLGKACDEWGFFLLVNHGVEESLMKGVLDACDEFFSLPEEEKLKYVSGKDPLAPIKFGTGVDIQMEKYFSWRDYFKCTVHPQFHFIDKPEGFREVVREYSKRIRELAKEVLKGISEGLGLEACYLENAMNFESGFQLFSTGMYPPCPKPELAIGLPHHSGHGLVTFLIENGVRGLQVLHKEEWVNVVPLPNSFMVQTADHLEILTNGKYKSRLHRAVVNTEAKRISIAMANGPPMDTVVSPAPEFVDKDHPPAVLSISYKEFVGLQQSSQLRGKLMLEHVRLQA